MNEGKRRDEMEPMLHTKLYELYACNEATRWARGRRINEASWHACNRGDWLLWLLPKLPEVDEARIVEAVCDIAEVALLYAGQHKDIAKAAIYAARTYTGNPSYANATRKTVFAARGRYEERAVRSALYAATCAGGCVLVSSEDYAYETAEWVTRAAVAHASNLGLDGVAAKDATNTMTAQIVRKYFTFEEVAARLLQD